MNNHSSVKMKWLGLIGLLAIGLIGVGCRSSASDQGQLEIRVWDHREAIDDFDKLWLTLSAIGIHPTGEPRTEGWLDFKPSVQKLDLTQYQDGQEVVIVQAAVQAGSYNAVRLIVDEAAGRLLDGQHVDVKVSFETSALDFRVRGSQTTIVGLDLTVLDMSDHPDDSGYELHLREAITK